MSGALRPTALPMRAGSRSRSARRGVARVSAVGSAHRPKKVLNDIEDANLSLGIELEGQAYGRLRSSDDFREGVEAFHQMRRPKFTGQ